MSELWQPITWESCPACGDNIEAFTDVADDTVCDSDTVRCVTCGLTGHASVDCTGETWITWCEEDTTRSSGEEGDDA
jgi:hypothetical protein